MEPLEGLVGMTRIPGSDSAGVILRLEDSRQSRAYDDCILDLYERLSCQRHGHDKPCSVQSKNVARTVSFKNRICPLSIRDRGISYALGDAFTLYEPVTIVIDRIQKE
ncbi:UNVERIFIED_CONTAM: hypothetical protein Sindi_3085500, partial [Sesamum indicum]